MVESPLVVAGDRCTGQTKCRMSPLAGPRGGAGCWNWCRCDPAMPSTPLVNNNKIIICTLIYRHRS